jgi:hypothetical protein
MKSDKAKRGRDTVPPQGECGACTNFLVIGLSSGTLKNWSGNDLSRVPVEYYREDRLAAREAENRKLKVENKSGRDESPHGPTESGVAPVACLVVLALTLD